MTDKEKLIVLLTEFDVGFTEYKSYDKAKDIIECREGASKVGGYNEFFTEFSFDLDGRFIEMGAGE